MTNEERDALIEGVRRRRAMASDEVHALLAALDEARVRAEVAETWPRAISKLLWPHDGPDDPSWDRVADEIEVRTGLLDDTAKSWREASAQLAALHAAVARWRDTPRRPECDLGTCGACGVCLLGGLRTALADTATAAAEHDARVRAPVEAERHQLAAALAEVRDAASESIRESFWVGNDAPARAARERVIAVLASLPADLAAQREARVRADERAKALRDGRLLKRLSDAALWESERIVRQVREFDRTGVSTAAYGEWDTLFEIVLGKVLRAMADEAERGTR